MYDWESKDGFSELQLGQSDGRLAGVSLRVTASGSIGLYHNDTQVLAREVGALSLPEIQSEALYTLQDWTLAMTLKARSIIANDPRRFPRSASEPEPWMSIAGQDISFMGSFIISVSTGSHITTPNGDGSWNSRSFPEWAIYHSTNFPARYGSIHHDEIPASVPVELHRAYALQQAGTFLARYGREAISLSGQDLSADQVKLLQEAATARTKYKQEQIRALLSSSVPQP